MLHGDLLRIEHAGGTSWRLLCSSQGHAPNDDEGKLANPTHRARGQARTRNICDPSSDKTPALAVKTDH